jgi:arylsulfatase A-like enzyme
MLMRRVVLVVRYLILISVLMLASGCDLNRSGQPSVMVIAVEGLDFETFSCDSDELAGFRAFCEESVRFSHAFTPSTMSQAAMTSLMTGLYPHDHGVRHNGDNFLSAKFRTLAEGALSRGYRTLFVSGGPPIWRKSGLAQGFEVFDDTMDLAPGLYYRPAGEVFRLVRQWVDQQSDGRASFVSTFLADLQFPQYATRTGEGELREQSFAAQLEEIDESLEGLVKWLKDQKRWNSTHIVLLGLNSLEQTEDGEPAALSLRSRATQVALFIKPARKERDNVIQWGVDRNVSLVDVGHTMHLWLGLEPPQGSLSELEAQSLVSALAQPEPNWTEGRLLLTESAWPDWLEGAGVRWSIRQNQFLYIHDQRPLIFNTLTDRMENLPLKISDPLWTSLNGDVLRLLKQAQNPPFKGMTPHWFEQLDVASSLWGKNEDGRAPKGHEAWTRWFLRKAFAEKKWREVKRLSQELGEPVGTYISARHLGETLPMPRNPCVRLMLATKGDKKAFQSECEDERVLALYAWQTSRDDDERAGAQDRFLKLYGQSFMDQEIGRMNYLNGLRWDVDREWPEVPQPVEYLLSLKELESFSRRVSAFLDAKNARL